MVKAGKKETNSHRLEIEVELFPFFYVFWEKLGEEFKSWVFFGKALGVEAGVREK
jgi:hypothetical protein